MEQDKTGRSLIKAVNIAAPFRTSSQYVALLFALIVYCAMTLTALIGSAFLMVQGLAEIFRGILLYFLLPDTGFYFHLHKAEGTGVNNGLSHTIQGIEFLLLSPMPIFILKGISFYVDDLIKNKSVLSQTKGVFIQIKVLLAALLIGVVSAVLVGYGVKMDLTYGKMILLIPVFWGLTNFYNKLDGYASMYHRPIASSGNVSKKIEKHFDEILCERFPGIESKGWFGRIQSMREKIYDIDKGENGERYFSQTSLLRLIKKALQTGGHGCANWIIQKTWTAGLYVAVVCACLLVLIGVVEILRGVVFAYISDSSISTKDSIAIGISGLEFLMLSPLALLVLHGVKEYFKDLVDDGHVSRLSRYNLLEVKTLLAGLLLSVLVTEMVGMAAKGANVGQLVVTLKNTHVSSDGVKSTEENMWGLALEDEDRQDGKPQHDKIKNRNFFYKLVIPDKADKSQKVSGGVSFEAVACNFIAILFMGHYFYWLLRHGHEKHD